MRVVVTLTTIPSREKAVVDTVRSIKNGAVVPDAIYVNLPIWYPNLSRSSDPKLKAQLEEAGAIVNVCEDYGTFTKFIPTLEIEKDPDTLIIIIDDDSVYKPNFVAGLVSGYDEFKCPVGFSGIAYPETVLRLYGVLQYHLFLGHGTSTEIIECIAGYAFKVSDIQGFHTIQPMKQMEFKFFYFSDDYVLSRFFKEKKVICYESIGRYGDDFSSICTPSKHINDSDFALSRNENNLLNFLKAGKLLYGT
jgi:hypothetical protein